MNSGHGQGPGSLDYLIPLASEKNGDWEKLREIKAERDEWPRRTPATPFRSLLEKLPRPTQVTCDFSGDWVQIGTSEELSPTEKTDLEKNLRDLIPWRKGPFRLFGMDLDAEWRSDFKWNRIMEALGQNFLKDKVILDIGCNNGYYLFRMAHHRPRLVLGIDPVLPFYFQFHLLQHFARVPGIHFELFELNHLTHWHSFFDHIFFMGIIYHHPNPIDQLVRIREALKPGGTVLLESLGIPGDGSHCLFPEGRYGKMKNVWFIPTLSALVNWAKKAGFVQIEVVSVSPSNDKEQRLTSYCPPPRQSYRDFLDPQNPDLTIEGYPAPLRFCVLAKKKG